MRVTFARHPSLELSWLPMSDRKGMPTPQIAYADLDWCSGCYCKAGTRFEDMEAPGARDTIFVSTRFGDVRGAVLAHEYRHLQQHYITSLPKSFNARALDFGQTFESWSNAIKEFYKRPYELDALLYERRLSPDEGNLMQWEAACA